MKLNLRTRAAVIALSFICTAPPAFAACDNHAPTGGETITCTGTDTNPVNGQNIDNVTVNLNGATMNTSYSAGSIYLRDSAQIFVDSASTIHSTGAYGMSIGDNAHIQFDGTLASGTTAKGILAGSNADITVNGTVNNGIQLQNGSVVVGSGGSVVGGLRMIFFVGTGAASVEAMANSTISGTTQTVVFSTTTGTFILHKGATVTGPVFGGSGALDELRINDDGNAWSFDTSIIGGAPGQYRNFEIFTKQGTGTTTLTGANALAWNVDDGTLVGNTSTITAADIASGATLELAQATNSTLAGNLTGGGALVKSGAGNLTLSGANTYSGGTTVSAGILTGTTTSLQGNILNNAAIVFDQNADGTYAGNISGTGSLTKSGFSTLTLSGANTYSGNTTLATGSLVVSASNNLGDSSATNTLTLENSTTLKYGASFDMSRDVTLGGLAGIDTSGFDTTLSGVLSGTGSILKLGAGKLTLSGTNTFAPASDPGLILNGGIVSISDDANLGAGSNFIVLNGGTLETTADITTSRTISMNADATIDTGSHTLIYNGHITPAATLTKEGSGTLDITGAIVTRVPATQYIVNDGELRGTAANLNVTIIDNGIVTFAQNTNGTMSRTISGTGQVVKEGTGNVTLAGTNTYTGGTTVSGGTLSGGVASIQGDIVNNAAVIFDEGGFSNATYAGSMSGTGSVEIGEGFYTFTGTNTYSGGTHLVSGTLTGDTNSVQGNIMSDGGFNKVTFDQNFDGTYSGNLSGGGQLSKEGSGKVTLTGNNTYSNETEILGGTLAFAAGALSANSSDIFFANFATLQTNADIAFANDIMVDGASGGTINTNGHSFTTSGFLNLGNGGAIIKTGAGTLNLTGSDSAITGTIDTQAGRTAVNGNYGKTDFLASNGGTLGGNGTLGSIVADSGGIIAPGNSIGTQHVNGDVSFNPGSIYSVEVNNAGQSDNIIASGNAHLNGGIVSIVAGAGTYAPATTYTILQTANINGAFASVHSNFAFLDPTLAYNASDVQLTLTRNDTSFTAVGRDDQQRGEAAALTDLGAGNTLYDAFTGLSVSQAQDALTQLSGEHDAGITTALAQTSNAARATLLDHMNGLSHGTRTANIEALAPKNPAVYTAALMEPSGGNIAPGAAKAWLEAIGTLGRSSASGTAPSQSRNSYGMIGGVDKEFADGGYYGAYAGYQRGDVTTDSQRASSDIDTYHLGVYATHPAARGMNISGGISGSYNDIDTVRYVLFPGFSAAPKGDTAAYTASAYTEISKPFDTGTIALEPFANVSVTYTHVDGYSESGGGAASLTTDSSGVANPETVLGLRVGKSVYTAGGNVNFSGSLGWQHTYGNIDSKTQMRFAGGNTPFSSYGAPRTRDAALLSLGADADMGVGITGYVQYSGELARGTQDHAFRLGGKWAFD